MRPLANPVATKIAFPANSSYGRPDFKVLQPIVNPDLTTKTQKKKKDIYIGTPQDQVGIIHNPYNVSRGCRSVNDLRNVRQGTGVSFNDQPLYAKPSDAFKTEGMVRDRMSMFGANFKQTDQMKISTWKV
jgi:hypothetical protein